MAQPTFDPEIVEALLQRRLSDDETLFADTLAGMVWRRIISRNSGLDTNTPAIAGDIVAGVVARVLRNPGGFRNEVDGDYSYTLLGGDPSLLEVPAKDWRRLTGSSGAFTINPLASDVGELLPPWDFAPFVEAE